MEGASVAGEGPRIVAEATDGNGGATFSEK